MLWIYIFRHLETLNQRLKKICSIFFLKRIVQDANEHHLPVSLELKLSPTPAVDVRTNVTCSSSKINSNDYSDFTLTKNKVAK